MQLAIIVKRRRARERPSGSEVWVSPLRGGIGHWRGGGSLWVVRQIAVPLDPAALDPAAFWLAQQTHAGATRIVGYDGSVLGDYETASGDERAQLGAIYLNRPVSHGLSLAVVRGDLDLSFSYQLNRIVDRWRERRIHTAVAHRGAGFEMSRVRIEL